MLPTNLPSAQHKISSPANDSRILIVDDNADIVEGLVELMQISGYEAIGAQSSEEALELGETFCPSVVLLDIRMPNIDGYTAARLIRQRPWGKSVALIAHTGGGQSDDRERASEAGFNFHLLKPANPEDLINIVSSLHAASD